jgi:hypothetical protein
MNLAEISRKIGISQIDKRPDILEKEVKGCYIGDLLSNVMARAQAGDIWLTVQTHPNVVAVAILLDLAAIVFVEGHLPQADTMERAYAEGMPLFRWPGSAYELSGALWAAGIGSKQP